MHHGTTMVAEAQIVRGSIRGHLRPQQRAAVCGRRTRECWRPQEGIGGSRPRAIPLNRPWPIFSQNLIPRICTRHIWVKAGKLGAKKCATTGRGSSKIRDYVSPALVAQALPRGESHLGVARRSIGGEQFAPSTGKKRRSKRARCIKSPRTAPHIQCTSLGNLEGDGGGLPRHTIRRFGSSDELRSMQSWFSLYQFASVKPGQLLGFKARHKAQVRTSQTTPMTVLPTDGPLVSVIVPNYNHAAFLDERIESILTQTYTNIEVLLMDDCSSDNSREVLQRWADKDSASPHCSMRPIPAVHSRNGKKERIGLKVNTCGSPKAMTMPRKICSPCTYTPSNPTTAPSWPTATATWWTNTANSSAISRKITGSSSAMLPNGPAISPAPVRKKWHAPWYFRIPSPTPAGVDAQECFWWSRRPRHDLAIEWDGFSMPNYSNSATSSSSPPSKFLPFPYPNPTQPCHRRLRSLRRDFGHVPNLRRPTMDHPGNPVLRPRPSCHVVGRQRIIHALDLQCPPEQPPLVPHLPTPPRWPLALPF